jgi:acetylornithine/N-succinyldiaminopimelate aminotransferase
LGLLAASRVIAEDVKSVKGRGGHGGYLARSALTIAPSSDILTSRDGSAEHPRIEGETVTHVLRCSGYGLVKTDIVRAQGCHLYDAQGKRYVDLEAGVWCTALGHSHPRVREAIRAQTDRVVHLAYRYTNDVVEEAAEAVLGTVGIEDGKCVFLSSGSEVVEFGVQVARHITGKPLLLALHDSYLAAYGSAGRKSADEWYCFDWRVCAACPHVDGCDPSCRHLRAIPLDRIGGLAFEPGSTSGLVRFPPRRLVRALARMVREQGGLVVVDEVTTGLGRTGAWYGFQHYGLQPDVVALGKSLGNGYPVSAIAMARAVAHELESSTFHYAQSHQNDPLGCAIAKTVIAAIRKEGLVERSKRVGAWFLGELEDLAERHDAIQEVRGRGLMIALEFAGGGEGALAISLYRDLLDLGFAVGCKPVANLLRFFPPLTIEREDIAGLLGSLDRILTVRR